MTTDNRPIHFKNFADFNVKKLSANEDNTTYTVGIDGVVTPGTPEINYQQVCWIKDTQQIWTHGQIYNCSGGSSDSGSSSDSVIPLHITMQMYYADEDGMEVDSTLLTQQSDITNAVSAYLSAAQDVNNDYANSLKYQWLITVIGGNDSVYGQIIPKYVQIYDDIIYLYFTMDGIKLWRLMLGLGGEFGVEAVSGGSAYTTWFDGVKYPEGGKLYYVWGGAMDVVCNLILSNFAENDTCIISAMTDATMTFQTPAGDSSIAIYLDPSVENAASATSGRNVYCIQRIGTDMYITASNFTTN